MENSQMMDNDSGYVSHNQESNLDSSSENAYKTKPCSTHDLYLSEDALLEKPSTRVIPSHDCKRFDSFDSIINTSQESVSTEFSGFEDSDRSDTSFVIPVVKPIVWDSNVCLASSADWKENSNDSIIVKASSSNGPSASFSESPPKPLAFAHKVLANVTNTYDQNQSQAAAARNQSSDKENVPPSETPKKLYENRLTSDVSPDLFSEEEDLSGMEVSNKQKCPMKRETSKEKCCFKDIKLLRKVQSSLNGVHPPPSVTIIQMTVREMLQKIDENKDLFWKSCPTEKSGKSLLIDNTQDCIQLEWPAILKCRYHGLHYNRNKISEEFEHMCNKYAERYVGAETQSTCTLFESNPSSSQKRKFSKPRWVAKSPGRRLSHLARRRITFSSANLQASSSSAILGSRARQILVDARKLLKKSPRKSPRKTPSKSPFKIRKNTPSSSAKKKLALRFRQMSGEFESAASSSSSSQCNVGFKRALFSNPTHEKDCGAYEGSIEKKSTKRALFSSPLKHSPQKRSPFKIGGLDRKRKRNDLDESNPSKFAKSISLDMLPTKSESKLTLNRTFSETSTRPSGPRPEELTDQHKKKLQWAVYESLRLQNITPTHPQYKVFASVLARVTRKFLPNLRFEGRTSEKMIRIARQYSYAVIKGKTVDEIFNEYLKNKIKNQKPQGYVGIEEVHQLKSRDENVDKENILQDKANIIESIEKRREHAGSKSRFCGQNRIDRIKKVISFEEKDS